MAEQPPDSLRHVIDAAADSVRYHRSRGDVEYPGYIWITWDDLVRFVADYGADDETEQSDAHPHLH